VQFEYLCIKGEGISLKSYFMKEADVFGTASTLSSLWIAVGTTFHSFLFTS